MQGFAQEGILANAVVFRISDRSTHITEITLNVDVRILMG